MKKVFCDWCDKEITNEDPAYVVLGFAMNQQDVCWSCDRKIQKLRKQIRKENKK